MSADHHLKTWPVPFQEIWDGDKTYEVRRFDRCFVVGDVLRLFEYAPRPGDYFTGRYIRAEIVHVMQPGQFGLPEDVGVMGIKTMEKRHINADRARSWCCHSELMTAGVTK